jgi:hypothetical protein
VTGFEPITGRNDSYAGERSHDRHVFGCVMLLATHDDVTIISGNEIAPQAVAAATMV